MKLSKRARWIVVVMVLAVSLTMALAQTNVVRAAITGAHAFEVYMRLETEIMQKTPAGRYYESLLWKHNDEIMQIMNAHPEHNKELLNATLLFVPELDSLVNGDGDKAYVTAEHVESLQSELDWFASLGSPALQEDIARESERLQLDHFEGMTINEAWDFINSSWSPDAVVEKTLVPDSDGLWAYYIHNGVYLEYPSSYNLQVSETEKDYVYFMPSTGMPENWNPCVVKVRILNIPVAEKDANNPRSWYAPDTIVWEDAVQNAEFPGIEFISSKPNLTTMGFHAFQYNQENQLAVDIWVFAYENPQGESLDYSAMVNQRYEYFQHMADSLRIWKP